jgi:ribose transport system substrate-binding protein
MRSTSTPWSSSRRRSPIAVLLAITAVFLAGCGNDPGTGGSAGSSDKITYVESIRSLSNEYHANWVKGGEFFNETTGKGSVKVLTDEGEDQTQLSKVKAQLAGGGENVVINVDPNSPANTEALVREAQDAGAYIVTQWNKPDDLHPWDGNDRWIAHISFDGNIQGKQTAGELFKAMGGKGNIIALQGILDNVPAKQRFAGLKAAMGDNPGIKLLEDQAADWDQQKAFQVTQTLLTKYGDRIDGVYAANDSMALGALEVLRSKGLAGKVPIVSASDATADAIKAIQKGEMVATTSTDAFWQGGIGLALGKQAIEGKLDPKELPNEQREFYGKTFLVTKANADEYLTPPTADSLTKDWQDPFSRAAGPIEY